MGTDAKLANKIQTIVAAADDAAGDPASRAHTPSRPIPPYAKPPA